MTVFITFQKALYSLLCAFVFFAPLCEVFPRPLSSIRIPYHAGGQEQVNK